MSFLPHATQLLKALTDRKHNQLIRLHFPHSDGPSSSLVANRIDAHESLSRDFHFAVEVLSNDPQVELKTVLGKMVTIELTREHGAPRFFNGYVFEFRFIRVENGLAVYDMVLLPWLAFLRLRKDNYLFHGATVEAQTDKIFGDYNTADWRSQALGDDPVMTDACQFDESDYNYLHRRWEALGWHYYYEHRLDGHTLVLSGNSVLSEPIAGDTPAIPWHDQATLAEDHGIVQFTPVRRLSSTAVAASSFDFKKPRPQNADARTVNHQGEVPALEVYEYTGAYGFASRDAGDALVRLRMAEIEAAGKHFEAVGNHRGVLPGYWFALSGHFDQNLMGRSSAADHEFLLIDVRHTATNNYEAGSAAVAEYHNRLSCLRKKIPWHPARGLNSVEPKIYGLQTAIVAGPKGSEIHSDEFGRVKVQFHWDRVGAYDEKSSAWVRVASTWAGSNFGFMAVPRIGQEVLVQFLDGNPDRPLITGRVYNAANMPPWDLPANQTQTGILTRSSKGGGYGNANAIRFEDKMGEEEVWLHAEKDQRIEVEHDETHWVGHDRSKTVDHDETVHVKHDRTETVDNDETITVHNNRTERVDHNETISIGDNRKEDVGKNETISIGDNRTESVGQNETISIGANRSEKVGKNETISIGMCKTETVAIAKALTVGAGYAVTVGGAMNTAVGLMQTEQVGLSKSINVGQTFTITVGEQLKIEVGESSFLMKADGRIEIVGKEISIRGKKKVEIHGDDVDTNPS
jgi:type VI secretion system secreted protein VgrG